MARLRVTEGELTRLRGGGKGIAATATKYGNKAVRLDGYTFDSKAECVRYQELLLMEKAGRILQLKVHPVFELKVKDELICTYEADFVYFEPRLSSGGATFQRKIVEDVKGVKTDAYMIKKKLMRVLEGIEIREIAVGKGKGRYASHKQSDTESV